MNNLILLDPYIIERDGPVPPVVWHVDRERHLRYEDIKADRYDETIEFLCSNYFGYETLCRSVGLQTDAESQAEMCALMRFLLRDECSIGMIDAATDRLVGVAIMKCMWSADYSWPFWRLLSPLRAASGCTKIVAFQCELMKYSLQLPLQLNTEAVLHAYVVCLARHMKGRLLKEQLLLQAYKVARSVGVGAFTWICTGRNDMQRALRVGLRCVDQKNYGSYTDAGGEVIFRRLDAGEHYASLFGLPVGRRAATSVGDYLFPEYDRIDENGGRVPGTPYVER